MSFYLHDEKQGVSLKVDCIFTGVVFDFDSNIFMI